MSTSQTSKSLTAALARIFEVASNPVYVLDAQRRLVYCNPACVRWVALPAEQMIGWQCNYQSSADDKHLLDRLCPPPEALHGKLVRTEIRLQSGEVRCVTFEPLVTDDELAAVVAVVGSRPLEGECCPESRRLDSAASARRWLERFYVEHAGHVPLALLGRSAMIRQARSRFALATRSDSAALIVGPPGSGKEEVARAILSTNGPAHFTTVPCAELGEQLLRSASDWLERAERDPRSPSAVILKGVDCLTAEMQASLANLIADGRFTPRMIGTAASSLDDLARQGDFLPALASELSTIVITIPPLSARLEDLPLIAQALVEAENARGGKQLAGFTAEAIDQCMLYSWPGELRELADVVRAAFQQAEGPGITPRDFPDFFRHVRGAEANRPTPEERIVLDDYLAQIELELIQRALEKAKGNKTKAAALLGMNRPRFYRRLEQLGLIAEPAERELPDFQE
jgi:transcriptional regulator with PAS, ATPase and Fis domain